MFEKFRGIIENHDLLEGRSTVIVLFSGGVDSSVLLHLLHRYLFGKSVAASLKAYMILYPRHMYNRSCLEEICQYWNSKGVKLILCRPRDIDPKHCRQCKFVRKKHIDTFVKDHALDRTVIASGYSLLDFRAYVKEIELLTQGTYDYSRLDQDKRAYIEECLYKMRIKHDLPTGLRVIRPLGYFDFDDLYHYVKRFQIPCIKNPCDNYPSKFKRSQQELLLSHREIMTFDELMTFIAKVGLQIPKTFTFAVEMNYFPDG